jgi:hypothetical protein
MKKIFLLTLFFLMAISCQQIPLGSPTSTPLPAWRLAVYHLLLDDNTFPEGWEVFFPEDTAKDPTINHVFRIWGRKTISGSVEQIVMRAYTIENAKNAYHDLQSEFTPTPSAFDNIFIPFGTPTDISFASQIADEWHFACGWKTIPYCLLTARYRNYVTYLMFPLEVEHIEYPGRATNGLTYEEIEVLLQSVDAKFSDFLQENPMQD